MELSIVPRYAAALALLFVLLSLNVIRARRERKVALGVADGGGGLERRVRVHGNFAEYAPFALLLLAMAELRGAPPLVLHALCLALLLGRAAHAWGVSRPDEDYRYRFRVAGMSSTFAAIAGAALVLALG